MNYLDAESKNAQEVCTWLSTTDLSSSTDVETVFYKAESLRLFKCTQGSFVKLVKGDVTKVLASPKELKTVSDYFQAYMLNKRATHYGLDKGSDSFTKELKSVLSK